MMDFVTHFPRTSQGHDAVWVIMDRLTKSAHFLTIRMTFTLEEFCKLYIYIEYQSLSYRTRIPGLQLVLGRVSSKPWGHN